MRETTACSKIKNVRLVLMVVIGPNYQSRPSNVTICTIAVILPLVKLEDVRKGVTTAREVSRVRTTDIRTYPAISSR